MELATTTNQRPRRGAVDPELLPVPLLSRPFLRSSTSAGLTGSRLSVSAGLFSNRLRALYGNAGSVVYYPRVPDGHWPRGLLSTLGLSFSLVCRGNFLPSFF